MSPRGRLPIVTGVASAVIVVVVIFALLDPAGRASLPQVILAWGLGLASCGILLWLHGIALRIAVASLDDPRPHRRMRLVVCVMFVVHVAEATSMGLLFYSGAQWMGLGRLAGETEQFIGDYIYFAVASYSSLGLGDVRPEGLLRLWTVLLTITGLMCIAWTLTDLIKGRPAPEGSDMSGLR